MLKGFFVRTQFMYQGVLVLIYERNYSVTIISLQGKPSQSLWIKKYLLGVCFSRMGIDTLLVWLMNQQVKTELGNQIGCLSAK